MATATLKRTFANGHAYHINSLSFNSDGETYLSADDLRINIWNMHTNRCAYAHPNPNPNRNPNPNPDPNPNPNPRNAYNIVDIKPDDMEELSEVIMVRVREPQPQP